MSFALDDVLNSYFAAWQEMDSNKRKLLLAQSFAEDGTYKDPTGSVNGRDPLVEHIGQVLEKVPDCSMELISAVDQHHGHIRFAWRMLKADGSLAAEGIDFGTLVEDGRLQEIVGFFGVTPPAA